MLISPLHIKLTAKNAPIFDIGCAFSALYLQCMIAVSQYFEKKRAMAIGISVCGSGLGTLSLAPFSKYILELYGWKGAHFILGKKFHMKTVQLFSAFI